MTIQNNKIKTLQIYIIENIEIINEFINILAKFDIKSEWKLVDLTPVFLEFGLRLATSISHIKNFNNKNKGFRNVNLQIVISGTIKYIYTVNIRLIFRLHCLPILIILKLILRLNKFIYHAFQICSSRSSLVVLKLEFLHP